MNISNCHSRLRVPYERFSRKRDMAASVVFPSMHIFNIRYARRANTYEILDDTPRNIRFRADLEHAILRKYFIQRSLQVKHP